MKLLAILSVIAFVAVQFSHSAPTPEEETKDAPVASSVAVAAREATAQPAAEAKSAAAESPAAKTAEAAPHAEEKKA